MILSLKNAPQPCPPNPEVVNPTEKKGPVTNEIHEVADLNCSSATKPPSEDFFGFTFIGLLQRDPYRLPLEGSIRDLL